MPTLEVVCPAGAAEGTTISVALAGGGSFEVAVPAGVSEGMPFNVEYQDPTAFVEQLAMPEEQATGLRSVLQALETVQRQFNAEAAGGQRVSMADLIVLAGSAAVEQAAAAGGYSMTVPFLPGRMDASADQTDTASFNVLKPIADGFRNWQRSGLPLRAEECLVDRAQQLGLSAPEMTVLLAGLRVLGANSGGNSQGVFTDRVGVLSNDFCVNLLDMSIRWSPTSEAMEDYIGRDAQGYERWTASRADLVFGSNSQLRAIVEVYAQDDGASRFVADFVQSWVKVMNLDRFDVR